MIENKPTAMYIHGLGSSANTSTAKHLREHHPHWEWLPAEITEDPYRDIRYLNKIIKEHAPEVIVGTSLGGLYTFYCNAPEAIKIMCNPALGIAVDIRDKIGYGTYDYFVERRDGRKQFTLDQNVSDSYEHFCQERQPVLGRQNYAIFAAHDELIGDHDSLDNMAKAFKTGYTIMVDPKGKHRLQRSSLHLIDNILSQLK